MKIINFLIFSFTCLCFSCLYFSCCKTQKPNASSIEVFDKIYPPLNYRITGAIVDGKKNGLWITYDSLGKVEAEETFVNGKNFGIVKQYSNGILFEKIVDKIIGSDTVSVFEKYNPYGKVLIEGQFVNGQKKGVWLYYFNNGKTLKFKIKYLKKGLDTIYKSRYHLRDNY